MMIVISILKTCYPVFQDLLLFSLYIEHFGGLDGRSDVECNDICGLYGPLAWLASLLAFVNNISIAPSVGTLCPIYRLVYIAEVSIFWAWLMLMDSQIPVSGLTGPPALPACLYQWQRGTIRCPLAQTSLHCLEKPPTTHFIILLLHSNSPRVGFSAAHWGLLMEPKWTGLTLLWNCVELLFDSGVSVKEVTSEAPANSEELCCSAR